MLNHKYRWCNSQKLTCYQICSKTIQESFSRGVFVAIILLATTYGVLSYLAKLAISAQFKMNTNTAQKMKKSLIENFNFCAVKYPERTCENIGRNIDPFGTPKTISPQVLFTFVLCFLSNEKSWTSFNADKLNQYPNLRKFCYQNFMVVTIKWRF